MSPPSAWSELVAASVVARRIAASGLVACSVVACGDGTVSVGNGKRAFEGAVLAELAESAAGTWYGTFPGKMEVALTLRPLDEPTEMSVGLRCTTENCIADDLRHWWLGTQPNEGTGESSQFAMATAQLTALIKQDTAGTRVEGLMIPEDELAQPARVPTEFWLRADGEALTWIIPVPVLDGPLDFVREPR